MAASTEHVASADLYDKIHRLALPRGKLRDNGYPYMEDGQGKFIITTFRYKDKPLIRKKGNQRICNRCSDVFTVDDDGTPTTAEPCFYHVGRYLKNQDLYSCCNQKQGCQRSEMHVHMYNFYNDTSGFVQTSDKGTKQPNVYALDCEMVFTSVGFEVIRAVLVDDEESVVLNELIKPSNPVVDWNTRFTGLTDSDLPKMTINLEDFQKKLLHLVCDKTILVGHSLDSDLIALKIVHELVVDTSILYMGDRGRKRGLKDLAQQMLGKSIQKHEAGGHDCAEDAKTAMQLALLKVSARRARSRRDGRRR